MSGSFRDENERLVAEQAVLVYRAVREAAQSAPHGQGLACMEAAVLDQGREHLRQMLERATAAEAEAQEKGGAVARAGAAVRPVSGTVRPER
jgi:hypothetical protein